jgi:hypothetical protein
MELIDSGHEMIPLCRQCELVDLARSSYYYRSQREPFDLGTYKQLLRKYKSQSPEKIFDRMDKENKVYSLDS